MIAARLQLMRLRPTFMVLPLILLLALIFAGTATGQSRPTNTDKAAIRQVIETQLGAFLRDDGATAFSQAAPMIRRRFGTPERFMAMVRSGYRAVYRARDVRFGRLARHRGMVVQEVRLTGPDGRRWLALYSMVRQRNGSWRISGCYLAQPKADI